MAVDFDDSCRPESRPHVVTVGGRLEVTHRSLGCLRDGSATK